MPDRIPSACANLFFFWVHLVFACMSEKVWSQTDNFLSSQISNDIVMILQVLQDKISSEYLVYIPGTDPGFLFGEPDPNMDAKPSTLHHSPCFNPKSHGAFYFTSVCNKNRRQKLPETRFRGCPSNPPETTNFRARQ